MKNIAVVTGASAGIGREFGKQLDGRPGLDEIWLIARRKDRLQALSREISQTKVRVLGLDLTTSGDIARLAALYKKESVHIVLFINNAGYGQVGNFAQGEKQKQLGMLDLNIRALTELTYDAIPYMDKGSGFIQVASVGGFIPIANMAVYAASKAYVISLSTALSAELGPSGIHCMALCPGAVKTEFLNVATNGHRQFFPVGMTPAKVVRRSLKAYGRKQWICVPSVMWTLARYISVIIPRKWLAWLTSLTKE